MLKSQNEDDLILEKYKKYDTIFEEIDYMAFSDEHTNKKIQL